MIAPLKIETGSGGPTRIFAILGKLHFPGFSAEVARFLLAERKIRGLGLDTMSVDYGLSRDFAVHHLVGAAGCYGLENVAHLDQLPPRGLP